MPEIPIDTTQANTTIEHALAMLQRACSPDATLTAEELRAWQARMGLSGRGAARLLGLSPPAYLDRANGISHTTRLPVAPTRTLSLACAALEVARLLKADRYGETPQVEAAESECTQKNTPRR